MAGRHLVFVYGTLRPEAEDKTPYYLHRYEMFSTGSFPYITPGDGTVVGQVLVTDNIGLEALDEYEGIARGLYTREKVNVLKHGNDGEELEVWAYIAGPALMRPKIASGDWLDYLQSKEM